MIYIKRTFFCIGILISVMILPFEMAVRYIISGKDQFKETFAYKLTEHATNRK